MKKVILALQAMICAGLSLQAQKSQEIRLNWGSADEKLNEVNRSRVDSIYETMEFGESFRVSLLSESEKALEEEKRALLSYHRAENILSWCRSRYIAQKDFEVEMVPFHQPNRLKSSEITNRSYRSFMSRRSESFLLLTKKEPEVTSQPSMAFDASVSGECQSFTFEHKSDFYVSLQSGTQLYVPGGILRTSNGNLPSCPEVNLCVAEYTTQEAMIIKGLATTSHGSFLQTNGMWHIQFTCNGQTLHIATGKKYYLRVRMEGEPVSMKVFTGKVKNGLLDWKEELDSRVKAVSEYEPYENPPALAQRENGTGVKNYYEDSMEYGEGAYESDYDDMNKDMYQMELNDVGWINCDAFYEVTDKTDVYVRCDTSRNMNVMLVFTKRKSILPGYWCKDKGTVKFDNIPSDEMALLVLFKKDKDGKMNGYTKMINPSEDKMIITTLGPTTETALKQEIYASLSDM